MNLAAVVAENVRDFAWVGGLHDELEREIVSDDIVKWRGSVMTGRMKCGTRPTFKGSKKGGRNSERRHRGRNSKGRNKVE